MKSQFHKIFKSNSSSGMIIGKGVKSRESEFQERELIKIEREREMYSKFVKLLYE